MKKTLVPSALPKPNPTAKPKVIAEKQRDGSWTFKKVLVSIEPDTDSPWAQGGSVRGSLISEKKMLEPYTVRHRWLVEYDHQQMEKSGLFAKGLMIRCDYPIGTTNGVPIACDNPATHYYAGHGFCDPHAGMVERGCLWHENADGTTEYETLLRAKSHRGEMVITGWFLPPSAGAQV